MKSLAQKLEQCEGLLGTKAVNDFETKWLSDNVRRYRASNRSTSWMSDRQIDVLEQIYDKHFA